MQINPFDRVVDTALNGALPKLIILFALLAGAWALQSIPREEEPQIVVPMVDVLVQAPGLSARQVERQVTTPLEKLLTQIRGVEHVYSNSRRGSATVTLAFFVGEDREEAILNTYNKLQSNLDAIPPVVDSWVMRPREVDDVPIILLALWSDSPARYSDFELRRTAEEISTYLQGIPQTSEVKVIGGRPRMVRVLLNPAALTARRTTASDIIGALQISNLLDYQGHYTLGNATIDLESGDFFRSVDELRNSVVNVIDGVPVYLGEVAEVIDGPDEAQHYTWIDFAPGHPDYEFTKRGHPMVGISIAKQRGSNAVSVAKDVRDWIARLEANVLPPEIHIEILRDAGKTADEKANYLITSLIFAVINVVLFIGVFLGWRPALVVGMAMPICYAITIAFDLLFGYTLNRVTMAALILSLGLLVDDPITGVDNITRHLTQRGANTRERIVAAMAEIRVPLLMSTVTIIIAFVPTAFISGLIGPYLAPVAFNVPIAVISSTVVAFLVTPWLSSHLLRPGGTTAQVLEQRLMKPYRRILEPLLADRRRCWLLLAIMLSLFVGSISIPVFRMVPFKLLPYDNKNEIQIVIDLPEGSSLERTAGVAERIAAEVSRIPEVQAIAAWVGIPSAIDFTGMVRRYYERNAPHLADLRLTLVDKRDREEQSHGLVLRLRQLLLPLQRDGVVIRVLEVPPGPPVLSTLVAEFYGGPLTPYALQEAGALALMERLSREAHVVEIDSSIEADRERQRFITDKHKAALSGVATADINHILAVANRGIIAGYLAVDHESRPLPIQLRMRPEERRSSADFAAMQVKARPGIAQQRSAQGLESAPQPLVAIGELGHFDAGIADKTILHKDLRPVVYVMAELSGRTPAEVIADLHADLGEDNLAARPWQERSFLNPGAGDSWRLPNGVEIDWSGEGEWQITESVFLDMGLGYAFALIAIYGVLRLQTRSAALSLIIMSSIPLTVIGIMPGFWLMNTVVDRTIAEAPDPIFLSVTAMVGMIVLAGIVIRNSLILVEFIGESRQQGMPLNEALIQAGAVRARPVLLTAGTTLIGNLVIALDPVFSGLALAIIFGIVASTVFTLVIVPVLYFLVFENTTDGNAA